MRRLQEEFLWGSGGTSNLVINTATNEKYAMVYDYDSETGSSVYRICALNDFLGMDEQGRDEENDRRSEPDGAAAGGSSVGPFISVLQPEGVCRSSAASRI